MTTADTTTQTTETDDRDLVAYAADVVAYRSSSAPYEEIEILLIRRRWAPFEGRWALPGGHVDADETAQAAAARELAEETGVAVEGADLEFVGLFDAPGRDPRGRVVSAAYVIEAPAGAEPVAADDAAEAAWIGMSDALGLAFDHDEIVRRAIAVAFPAPARASTGACAGCEAPWRPVDHEPTAAADTEDRTTMTIPLPAKPKGK